MHRAISKSPATEKPAASGPLWFAAIVLSTLFLVSEHDLRMSQQESFAPSISETEENISQGDRTRQITVLALAAFGALLFLRRDGAPLGFDGPLGLIALAICGWCLLSVGWSDDSSLTLRRLAVLMLWGVAALGVCRQLTVNQICLLALVVLGTHIAAGLMAEIALGTFRPHSPDYRFAGTLHPNSQGHQCAAACLAAWCLWRSGSRFRLMYLLLFFIGMALVLLTKSRSTLAALTMALAICGLMRLSVPARAATLFGAAWFLALAVLGLMFFEQALLEPLIHAVLLGREEETLSLTGRIPLWTFLVRYAGGRYLTGYGYESFWTPERTLAVSEEFQWTIPNAHSAYLDLLLTLGVPGLLLLICGLAAALSTARRRFHATREIGYQFFFGLLVFGAAGSLLESGFFSPSGFVSFLALCVSAQLAAVPLARAVQPALKRCAPRRLVLSGSVS